MPESYVIIIKGGISPAWSDWLAEFSIEELEGGLTRLSGTLEDQAALHGLLRRIRDLNLKLVSVNTFPSNHPHPGKGENYEEK
jgi:hypothetical protein